MLEAIASRFLRRSYLNLIQIVTTSKALVTSSVALVTSSVALLRVTP